MRSFFLLALLLLTFSFTPAQTRQEAIEKLNSLKREAQSLEQILVAPAKEDISAAAKENVNVFRILPREIYDKGLLNIRGGGAFYSFTRKTHEYGQGSDLALGQGNFSVGFAGADYGFIYDLGESPFEEATKENDKVRFLISYSPPANEPEIRAEQQKARNYEISGITYKDRVLANLNHTYILRSINFERSDVLVVFKVHRKDTDGSLIVFWKLLENFEKPLIARN